jgi:hypothetical protein
LGTLRQRLGGVIEIGASSLISSIRTVESGFRVECDAGAFAGGGLDREAGLAPDLRFVLRRNRICAGAAWWTEDDAEVVLGSRAGSRRHGERRFATGRHAGKVSGDVGMAGLTIALRA